MKFPRVPIAILGLLLAASVSAGNSKDGLHAYNAAEYATALAVWQPLAEAGDADSQYGLGMIYGNGFGAAMDDALAMKWYGLAADQGHAQAQLNLAVMYQNGWGVDPNEEKAVIYYAMAAEQGVTEAMLALGRHFSMDFSESYDPVEAYKWYSLAAMFKEVEASGKREMIAAKMSAEQVADGNALVDVWSNGHSELLAKQ